MNKNAFDVLRILKNSNSSISTQRNIAEALSCSLGLVNKIVTNLKSEDFITENLKLTKKAESFLENSRPKNAVILAAGYGLRMVPINQNKPKALLTIDGKPLIERLIEQLIEAGVKDITIIVGFMKLYGKLS